MGECELCDRFKRDSYKRQREDTGSGSNVITANVAAEATLAIWRRMPQQAKFRRRDHFGNSETAPCS